MQRILLILAVVSFKPVFAQAQDSCTFSLSGYVIDEHDKSPLSYATIMIKEIGNGTIADRLGHYIINGLCGGKYIVVCEHIGCEPVEKVVSIDGNTTQNFYPEHHAEQLKEISITGKKAVNSETQSQESLNKKDLEESAGKNLAETVHEITGVNILQSGPSIAKPIIHGLHSSRVLIINNGIRQEDQQWGEEHAPDVDPFIASRITVIKGAGVLKYGSDAVGGVILIDPAPLPLESKLSGDIHAVEMSNGWQSVLSAQLQGGAKNWKGFGWRVQGTGKISGDLHAPDYNLSNTGTREAGTSATLGLKRDRFITEIYYSFLHRELAILRASHTGNLTDLQNAISSEQPWYIEDFTFDINNPKQTINHHLLKAKMERDLQEKWKIETRYGFQFNNRKEFDIRRGGRSDIPAIDLQLQTHIIDLNMNSKSAEKFRHDLGIAGFYQRNYNVPGTGIRPLIPNYQSASAGIYAIEKYVWEKGEAEAGVRYDFKYIDVIKYNQGDSLIEEHLPFHNASATLGVLVHCDGFTFRSNAGLSFRPPAVNELFSEGLHHGAASIEEGDENLNTEKGFKLVGSIDYRHENIVDIRLLGYYNYILDYIYLQPRDEYRLTIRGAFPVFNYLQTNVSLAGIDFSGSVRTVPNLFLKSKVSFIRAHDISQDDYLIGIPAPRFEETIAYEREEWNRIEDVNFSLSILNVLKQKWVPEAKDFSPPPDAYFLLGFYAGCSIPLTGSNKLGIRLSVENLLDKTYRDYMNRFRYYADDVGRNFTLRIHYSF